MWIEQCSVVALARLAPAKPPIWRYTATKSKMTSQLRRESLYNSANTKRYGAETLAVSGLVAGGTAVWLHLRGGNCDHDATTKRERARRAEATGLALLGQF